MGGKTSKEQNANEKEGRSNEAVQDLTKNKNWVKKMEEYFDAVDLNKNGYLTVEEILKWSDNMKELCSVSDDESENLQKCLKDFYGAAGLLPGKQVTKEEFIEGVSHLSEAELERKKNGEETLMESLCNAFYNVMDLNDDGKITLNEVKTIMKACNMTEDEAEKWFNLADKNKNGVVETHELTKAEFESWFSPEEEDS
ncbi:obelin-like [Dendronephthya gigantea]|uniref:obelin-like n=1 Tax=Dendronephthya gigantea TaxID=151771 RepID=UPI00106B809B|nr:obelin-like [Dendronephthya gigantea]